MPYLDQLVAAYVAALAEEDPCVSIADDRAAIAAGAHERGRALAAIARALVREFDTTRTSSPPFDL